MVRDTAAYSVVRDRLVAGSQICEDETTLVADLYGGVGQEAEPDGTWKRATPVVGALTMRMGSKEAAWVAQDRLENWADTDRPVIMLIAAAEPCRWVPGPATGGSRLVGRCGGRGWLARGWRGRARLAPGRLLPGE